MPPNRGKFNPGSTAWDLIRGAAAGDEEDRAKFVRLYMPVVRSYLEARWRDSPVFEEVEDTAQDVFVECFRDHGVLARVQPGQGPGGFRAFLLATVRNVARRTEDRLARLKKHEAESALRAADERPEEDSQLSESFERAWFLSLLDQAVIHHEERARRQGSAASRRVELLRLRFNHDLPIREIARRWDVPAPRLHHEYATARREFVQALRDVVAFHYPDDPSAIHRVLARLRVHLR